MSSAEDVHRPPEPDLGGEVLQLDSCDPWRCAGEVGKPFTSHRALAMLVGLAVVVGLTAGCGGAVSNKGTENGDAGAQDATSASSTSDTSAPAPDAGSDGPGGSSVACVGPSDCPMQNGLQVYCCVDKTCIFGQAAESTSCADPDAEVLQASKYDQSCTTDADCVGVAEGNFCQPNPGCPNAAINKTALPRYMSDVGETYGGGSCTALSSCGLYYGPCCRQGMCQMNTGCDAKPSDTLPACAEAGGACGTFVTSCGVRDAGPSDSCAYPDEMCCLP